MSRPFRTGPQYQPVSTSSAGLLSSEGAGVLQAGRFGPAEEEIAAIKEHVPDRPSSLSKKKLLSWIYHPNERVPMTMMEHRVNKFTVQDLRPQITRHLLRRTLFQADQEGLAWTPLIDCYCEHMEYNTSPDKLQPPELTDKEERLKRMRRWIARQSTFEDLRPLFSFQATELHKAIAEIRSDWHHPAAREWTESVLSRRGSAGLTLVRAMLRNNTLSSDWLLELIELVRDDSYSAIWPSIASHPQAGPKHWRKLIGDIQVQRATQRYEFLPNRAFQDPEICDLLIDAHLPEISTSGLPTSLVRKQTRLLVQLLDGPRRERVLNMLDEHGHVQLTLALLESQALEPEELPDSLLAQIMAYSGYSLLHKQFQLSRELLDRLGRDHFLELLNQHGNVRLALELLDEGVLQSEDLSSSLLTRILAHSDPSVRERGLQITKDHQPDPPARRSARNP